MIADTLSGFSSKKYLPALRNLVFAAGVGLCASSVHAQTGGDYFDANVATYVEPCMACHTSGGVAETSGARLVLVNTGTTQGADNYAAFEAYLGIESVDAALLLSNISGGSSHGGGNIHSVGSAGYNALSDLASFIEDGVAGGGGGGSTQDFWDGLVLEPRERTLRRAAILMGGSLPTPAQIKAAKRNDTALRNKVLQHMKGDEFHKFLLTGANDRIHTLGFANGMVFEFSAGGTYPAANIEADLPSCDELEASEDPYAATRNLNNCNYGRMIGEYGMYREPLELIAYVVEKNRSYKQILTARFTMANRFLNDMYRGGNSFQPLSLGMEISPEMATTFKTSKDKGQPNMLDPVQAVCDPFCRVLDHGRFINRPHAGVLTSPAWLARYPTTDTNRNRARARWTFYHFLGVDIEKSAPRSTDPEALADTNNPTLNNPACTVCHERLDPVAGTYQNFDDFGTFKRSGADSLADTYKYPEWFGGEPGDTPYQQGDTWYRDMRKPGINGKKTAKKHGSVLWLAQQIVKDSRFAKATVAFWWPAIMGSDPLEQPTEAADPHYQQQLAAYNAQQAVMDELADKFRKKGFKAKQLFADMILSDWYRAEGFEGDIAGREVALATVGAGRLLSAEELDRKNFALFGARWNENNADPWDLERFRLLTRGSMYLAYGGIDSAAILDRPRELTPLMTNVAERLSIDYACRVPAWELNREKLNAYRNHCAQDPWYESDWESYNCGLAPPEQRPKLFTFVDKSTVPNPQNQTKIENQIVKLYEHMYGVKITRNHEDVRRLYTILEARHEEFKQNGWIDNPCWMGDDYGGEWIWDIAKHDPQAMVSAWGSVIRAMMTHYRYIHE